MASSSSDEACNFFKITVNATQKLFYVFVSLHEVKKEYTLTLSDGHNSWSGKLQENELHNAKGSSRHSYEELVKPFVKGESAEKKYAYQIKDKNDGTLVLIWKQCMDEDVKYQLGQVVMYPCSDPAEVTRKIFEHSIAEVAEMTTVLNQHEEERERIEAERNRALERLKKEIDAKKQRENELFSMFTEVLNEKKQKASDLSDECNHLNEELNHLHDGLNDKSSSNAKNSKGKQDGNSAPPKRKVKANKHVANKRPAIKEITYEDETDESEDTDDQKKQPSSAKKIKKDASSVDSSNHSQSLIFDDDSPQTSASPAVLRRRQPGGNKKQTPAKPIIPRVTSTPTSSQRSTKTNITKKNSGSSTKSSQNVDADDLFGDF